ncbi:MAG: hypothetical protein GY810_19455 [Aureispira sp.]|nr:hypothetical protein [Aureispira sp.]
MRKGQVIFPPNYPQSIEGPIVFLAGPIQGAPDWQREAITYLQLHAPHINIASPRKEYLDGTFVYGEQVDWETHFLNQAAQNGVVLFFLAKEEVHYPDRAYAQTTRFELGEWKAKQTQLDCNMVVGIQNGFTNARYIKRRLTQDNPNVPIMKNIEATCQQVIDWVG